MKHRTANFFYLILIAFACNILFITAALAQDPSVPTTPDFDPDAEVPIDGGASLLVAAGVAYGLKKIHDKRKKSKSNSNLS